MARARRTVRAAFTMAEIIVALAIMAVLGGVIIPRIAGYVDSQRISSTADTLTDLANAIKTFKTKVGFYPGQLTQLADSVQSTAPADTTDCRPGVGTLQLFTSTQVTNWRNAPGPFYPKAISTTGLQLPIGLASNPVIRSSNNTTAGTLAITINFVNIDDARDLNTLIDGPTDVDVSGANATGAVRYGAPPANKQVTVTYVVPVGQTC